MHKRKFFLNKKVSTKIFLMVFLFLLSGFIGSCAELDRAISGSLTEPEMKAKLDQFVGIAEDKLILNWGVPYSVYDTGGIHYATYHYVSPNGWNWCDITFKIENKIISGYTRRGNLCHYFLR